MKTLLVCHHDAPLHRLGMARWLASFSDLSGIVEIHESRDRLWRRVRREIGRVGTLRFLDVLAFRTYERLRLAAADREPRSEEHTSELQSLTNLVCRLLLEKKNIVPLRLHDLAFA